IEVPGEDLLLAVLLRDFECVREFFQLPCQRVWRDTGLCAIHHGALIGEINILYELLRNRRATACTTEATTEVAVPGCAQEPFKIDARVRPERVVLRADRGVYEVRRDLIEGHRIEQGPIRVGQRSKEHAFVGTATVVNFGQSA